jgi:glycine/D-amino acid oxidase-like deaminating enzyme
MKDYGTYSFWLETSGDDLTPRPPLDGSIRADVAILGAGFTGLWTAYHLLQREPSLDVCVVEAEIAGFGASGRNGGWCFSGFPVSPGTLKERYGLDAARAVSLAMYDSVDDVGRVCQAEGIDAHYAKGGALEIARAEYDLPKLEEMYEEFRATGLEDHYQLLDAAQTEERMRVERAAGSFWDKEGAAVQPARLARGLARAVERHGGKIYEQTRVTDYIPGPLPRLDTTRGNISAHTIVLAGEAYLSQLPKLRRQIMPMTSHIVVTEPLSDEHWAQIGWERREVVGGFGTHGGYLQHTADGRIAFGPYRGQYPFNSKITDALDRKEAIFEHARISTLDWFPMLRGVRFTHSWGGVFGVPRDHMPVMAYDRQTGVAAGYGYTGEGVATANLSGRVLADLITERDTDLTRLPMTTHRSWLWEPEPLRWAGFKIVRRSRQKTQDHVERTGRYPESSTIGERLWDSAPTPAGWIKAALPQRKNDHAE